MEKVRPKVSYSLQIFATDLDPHAIAKARQGVYTRLVALRGYAQPEDRERSREAGFDAHLAKPPNIDAVNAVLTGDG